MYQGCHFSVFLRNSGFFPSLCLISVFPTFPVFFVLKKPESSPNFPPLFQSTKWQVRYICLISTYVYITRALNNVRMYARYHALNHYMCLPVTACLPRREHRCRLCGARANFGHVQTHLLRRDSKAGRMFVTKLDIFCGILWFIIWLFHRIWRIYWSSSPDSLDCDSLPLHWILSSQDEFESDWENGRYQARPGPEPGIGSER